MLKSISKIAFPCLLIATAGGAVWAQAAPPQQPETKPIELSVNYQFALPAKSSEAGSQFEASEQARRQIYEIMGGECRLLLATIATSCSIERMNVQTGHQRGDGMSVGGSASFKIVLKKKS